MGQQNNLVFRLKRKCREHIEQPQGNGSLLRYLVKMSLHRLKRKFRSVFIRPDLSPLPSDTVNMAVLITGGLGDLLVIARTLRQMAEHCPACRFYVFHPFPDQGKWVFRNCSYVADVLPEFFFETYSSSLCDCGCVINSFLFFHEEVANPEKIRKLCPSLMQLISVNRRKIENWWVFVENHPCLDGAAARQIVALGYNRYSFLSSLLAFPAPSLQLDLPVDESKAAELQQRYPRYITLNTGFDRNFIMSVSRATKCYPDEYWQKLVYLLKERFPGLGIIQLGGGNGCAVSGTDENLSGKTTLSECAGILKHSLLHLDIEGGLVHLCASLGVRSAVLFGPTSPEYFSYPDNLNFRDSACSECWWVTERWMEACPKQNSRNECMWSLPPERVLAGVEKVL